MKTRTLTLLAIGLGAMLATRALAQDNHGAGSDVGRGDVHSPSWKKVEELKGEPVSPRFPKVGDDIKREVLPNGLVLYLREDPRLPLLRADMIVKTGSYYEAPDQLELSSFALAQMREGGTQKLGPLELSERLAFLAANLNANAGDETATVSLDILSKQMDEGLNLFADVILHPAFDADRLELAKRSTLFRLRHRNDSPAQVLGRELNKLMFTDAHPRGRETKPADVQKLTRDALVEFHRRAFSPDRAYLAVVGDFKHDELVAKLNTLFGSWKKNGESPPPLPTAKPVAKPGIYVVDRDLNQSNIAMVHWGVNRDSPDRYAIGLMNAVLGGGSFSSRITERVRSDEGLAYSAGSQFQTGDREVGFFRASVQTKTETTVRAIQCIGDEIRKMQSGKISDNEFKTAKESLLYSYVFRFDDPSENVSQLMRLEIEGLPADYYEKEFKGYQAVTRADMERAAANYLRPNDLTIFVVGKLEQFKPELAKLGDIHQIELTEFDLPGGGRAPGSN
jgi:zinc protease